MRRFWMLLPLLLTSCVLRWQLGAPFTGASPDTATGLVYLYRLPSTPTAMQLVRVRIGGESHLLYSGGYTALRLPPGRYQAYVEPIGVARSPTNWGGYLPSGAYAVHSFYGLEGGVAIGVKVEPGAETFLQVESRLQELLFIEMPPEQGRSEIGRCRVTPGGDPG